MKDRKLVDAAAEDEARLLWGGVDTIKMAR